MKAILITKEKASGSWVIFTSSSSRFAPDLGAALRRVRKLVVGGYDCLMFLDSRVLRSWERVEDPRYSEDHKLLLRALADADAQLALAPWMRGSTVAVSKLRPTPEDTSRRVIYTDGSCLGNPGFGGWAFSFDGRTFSGGALNVTNNQMELQAAIKALKHAETTAPGEPLRLCSDSRYVVNGATSGRHKWARSEFQGIANPELWKRFDRLLRRADVEVVWVKAHAGHAENEKVDAAARKAAYAMKSTGSKTKGR